MAKQTIRDLQKQYDDFAAECAKLSGKISAAEHNRIRSGSPVNLSPDAARFKELMTMKAEAHRELIAAKDAVKLEEDRKLDEARALLEKAGRLPPQTETHTPELVSVGDE